MLGFILFTFKREAEPGLMTACFGKVLGLFSEIIGRASINVLMISRFPF